MRRSHALGVRRPVQAAPKPPAVTRAAGVRVGGCYGICADLRGPALAWDAGAVASHSPTPNAPPFGAASSAGMARGAHT